MHAVMLAPLRGACVRACYESEERLNTDTMPETIRRLRDEGRKRAVVGDWHVTLGGHYALFEHVDDRTARLEQPKPAPAPLKAGRRAGRRRQLAHAR